MIIGIPKEIKPFEYRVALTPGTVKSLVQKNHVVFIERGAGVGAGFGDLEYRRVGAKILKSHRTIFQKSEIVVKVKEPQPSEYALLRPHFVLFSFLHLAANPSLEREIHQRKVKTVAYELVQDSNGYLPLLAPMSEMAGQLAALMGANYLRKDLGGKGTLLGSVGRGGTGHVTILGAGHVGTQALRIAHGLGASVSIYDLNQEKLKILSGQFLERLQIFSDPRELPEIIRRTDLLIGAVLVPGKRAPIIITKEMVQLMEQGSVIVDVAVDQGGCIETTRPTTLKNPIYKKYGILHCGVTNLPSLAPRTATEALSRALLPYLMSQVNPLLFGG